MVYSHTILIIINYHFYHLWHFMTAYEPRLNLTYEPARLEGYKAVRVTDSEAGRF